MAKFKITHEEIDQMFIQALNQPPVQPMQSDPRAVLQQLLNTNKARPPAKPAVPQGQTVNNG